MVCIDQVAAGLIRGCWMFRYGLAPSSVVAELGVQLVQVRRSRANRVVQVM